MLLNRAKTDQTAGAAAQRVRYHMGEQADELFKGRYQIVK